MRKKNLLTVRCKQRWRRRALRHSRPFLSAGLLCIITAFLVLRKRKRRTRHEADRNQWSTQPLGVRVLSQPFASNILVSELNRLIFCPVPKAANSNWKYLLRKWEGLSDYKDLTAAHSSLRSGLRYLSDYSAMEVEELLQDPNYFRFLFVRNPYSRALSCYMDKFRNEDPEYVQKEYRAFLAQLFGWRHARNVDIYNDPRPSFAAFVDGLAKQAPEEMNSHWKPQTLLCGLGIVPYDFIGRMENLTRDAEHIFKQIGQPDERFPTQEEIGFPPSGASKDIATELYSGDLRHKVRVIYDTDFRLLGYK